MTPTQTMHCFLGKSRKFAIQLYQAIDYLPKRVPSSKLTWQWKFTFSNRKYTFKWWMFHCYVSLPEGNLTSLLLVWKNSHQVVYSFFGGSSLVDNYLRAMFLYTRWMLAFLADMPRDSMYVCKLTYIYHIN